jgi:hypothetical protein
MSQFLRNFVNFLRKFFAKSFRKNPHSDKKWYKKIYGALSVFFGLLDPDPDPYIISTDPDSDPVPDPGLRKVCSGAKHMCWPNLK